MGRRSGVHVGCFGRARDLRRGPTHLGPISCGGNERRSDKVMSLSRRLTGALTLTAAAIGGAASRHRQTMSLATRLTAAVVSLGAVPAAAMGFFTHRHGERGILQGWFGKDPQTVA